MRLDAGVCDSARSFKWALGLILFEALGSLNGSAEVVFQDFFTQSAGSITNSMPWINVQGGGWQSGVGPTQLASDGNGHMYNAAANSGVAGGVLLVPIGPHGSLTASALIQLPVGSSEWIGMGFANSNAFLTAAGSGSGPWLQVQGKGNITLYGGTGASNAVPVANAFTNTGDPVEIFLTYDAYHKTASAGTFDGNATNFIFSQLPVTNSTGSSQPRYLVFQMSTNLTTPTARWAGSVTVDWIPRPPPMLVLPVPISNTVLVGSPGTNDIQLIQNAFNSARSLPGGTEVRFTSGATYVISNGLLVGGIPVVLSHATNAWVNGNGCKILITNPRIGFMSVSMCSNIIVQGFSVDYDPLPYTQGVVTHNFYTGGDVPKEMAIEFQVDAGYPTPTSANYIDANAMNIAKRWGTVMDTNQLGRLADNAFASCDYTNVVQTNSNGAFKVYLQFLAQAKSVQPGQHWCMISRWNGSSLFYTYESPQVTWMDNTNYAGAGASYAGAFSPLVCEINDQIGLGPMPTNATMPRLKASNADGGLFVSTRIGPWVQGCNFNGLGDDNANACLAPFVVTNVPVQPTNTFSVWDNPNSTSIPTALLPFQAWVGDSVLFFNPTNGTVFDRATVTAVNLPNLTFDHAVSNIVAGTYDTNTVLVDQTLNTSVVYLNNQFSNGEFHGIYCRANNMLIAHNSVSGMGSGNIGGFPFMTTSFLNLFVPTNVVIMDNVLSDCSFTAQALSNAIPSQEPSYSLIELHQASIHSDYVTNGQEISGIRILYNALLNWRRAAITLHNATDVRISGNYFGPPLTNNASPTNVLADLWASDYPNVQITNNVNATSLPGSELIAVDGTNVSVVNASQPPSGPRLVATLAGTSVIVSWSSLSPGFVLQESDQLSGSTNGWADVGAGPVLAGESNVVTVPTGSAAKEFYRARQR
jgi:hypothetical protein